MLPAERYVFHLAFPVADLAASKEFYCRVLGARVGRENREWLDVLLWGHQITLHCRPGDVLPDDRRGNRHFGVVLPWSEWEALAERLRRDGVAFLREPHVLLAGTAEEQAKFHLEDPSHNVIEVKAYRDLDATLRQDRTASRYDRS
jgi:extradiol dioxygenase family protein